MVFPSKKLVSEILNHIKISVDLLMLCINKIYNFYKIKFSG